MIVIRLDFRCIEAQMSGGDFHGTKKVLPRIFYANTEGELLFNFMHKQFPITLCFAMTVNKSQAQTLSIVGQDLRTFAFTHGYFYVAMSQVTDITKLAVLETSISPVITHNIVYPPFIIM